MVRRFITRFVMSLAGMAITGCGYGVAGGGPGTGPRPLAVVADSAEYLPFRGVGAAELAGQAFLTTRGGDVKLAAGRTVTLDPATSYEREWFRRFGALVDHFDSLPPDPLFAAARRVTTADAEGRFRFTQLTAGTYLVRTTVTWETGAAYAGQEGGVVAALVTLQVSGRQDLVLHTVFTPLLAASLGMSIVTDEQLGRRHFRVVGRVSGLSCEAGEPFRAATEEGARGDILVSAARQGADAVARVICRRRGVSLIPNCTSRVVCEGDAIAWLS